MATYAEIIDLARRFACHETHPDLAESGFQNFSEAEQRTCMAFALYEMQRKTPDDQRRAWRLLRSWLAPEQRRQLTVCGYFDVEGTAGGRYRLWPRPGLTCRLRRHGRRWYEVARFCLHDAEQDLPPADLCLAHYVMIATDEPAFLAQANEWPREILCWSGDYRRRMNAARQARAAGLEPAPWPTDEARARWQAAIAAYLAGRPADGRAGPATAGEISGAEDGSGLHGRHVFAERAPHSAIFTGPCETNNYELG